MARRDVYHDIVVEALEKDGWTVTDDPLRFYVDDTKLEIDLAAETVIIGAEQGNRLIAVEIKSFVGASIINETQKLLGQIDMYLLVLAEQDPDRELIAAIPLKFYNLLSEKPFLKRVIENKQLRMFVFDEVDQSIVRWIE